MADFKLRCHCGATFISSKMFAVHTDTMHNGSYLDEMSFPDADELADFLRTMGKAS